MKSVLHTTPAVDPAYMIHYIFFIGYFASMDFGDKNNPRDAGIYFVVILSLGIGIAGLNLLKYFVFCLTIQSQSSWSRELLFP